MSWSYLSQPGSCCMASAQLSKMVEAIHILTYTVLTLSGLAVWSLPAVTP